MPIVFIRPKQGMHLRDLAGAVVPPYGVAVEQNSFWVRKTNDNDAEEITEADFIKGKKAFDKAAEVEATRLLQEQAKNDSTPATGA